MSDKKDRRHFLKLLISGGAVAATGFSAKASPENGEARVPMLTEDGRLVHVDKRLLEKLRSGSKARTDEIREFVKHRKPGRNE